MSDLTLPRTTALDDAIERLLDRQWEMASFYFETYGPAIHKEGVADTELRAVEKERMRLIGRTKEACEAIKKAAGL